MSDKPPLKIIEFYASNFKRIKVVDIRPDTQVVRLSGENGAGKTSCLDGIWAALCGGRAIPDEPIRQGEESATLKLDIGDFKITRKFARKDEGGFSTSLRVEAADGTVMKSPQGILDALIDPLAIDPVAFMQMKPDEQFDTLRPLVPGVDFEAMALADTNDFAARAVENRKVKDLRAQADGIVLPPGAVPKPVDVSALEAKLGEASTHNTAIATRKANRDMGETRLADLDSQIARLQGERAALKQRMEEAGDLPDPIDVTQVQADLQAARLNNITAGAARQKAALIEQADAAEAESKRLTKAMADREKEKQAAIAAASMPVAGLSFGDKAILLNGVPFAQGSDAEQLRASIAIAAAMNPRLRIVRVRQGSLLSEKVGMKMLTEFCAEHDLQAWVERNDDTSGQGFELVEGRLSTDQPAEDGF